MEGDAMSTEAEKAAVKRYQATRDNIMLRLPKEDGQKIRKAAADAGQSVQAFVLRCCLEHLEEKY